MQSGKSILLSIQVLHAVKLVQVKQLLFKQARQALLFPGSKNWLGQAHCLVITRAPAPVLESKHDKQEV